MGSPLSAALDDFRVTETGYSAFFSFDVPPCKYNVCFNNDIYRFRQNGEISLLNS